MIITGHEMDRPPAAAIALAKEAFGADRSDAAYISGVILYDRHWTGEAVVQWVRRHPQYAEYIAYHGKSINYEYGWAALATLFAEAAGCGAACDGSTAATRQGAAAAIVADMAELVRSIRCWREEVRAGDSVDALLCGFSRPEAGRGLSGSDPAVHAAQAAGLVRLRASGFWYLTEEGVERRRAALARAPCFA